MDTTMNTTESKNGNKLTAIEKALAAAKARKAASAAAAPSTEASPDGDKTPSVAPPSKEARNEARAAKKAQIEADRAARAAARSSKRADKVAPVRSAPAHMKKVEKAAAKLPALAAPTAAVYDEVTTNFGHDQLAALALHIQHFNRVTATQRSAETKLEVGMRVRITGGEARFVGREGRVTEVRRIRCYVEVPGHDKPVYCFTSDVLPTAAEEPAAAAE